MSTANELRHIFDVQRQHQWLLRKGTGEQRVAKLQRLRSALLEIREEIDVALASDMERPKDSAASFELDYTIKAIDETVESLPQWMAPTELEPTNQKAGDRASLVYEPRGVVLLLGPWNFPFLLVFEPLVAAFSAGNCVIVKPSEMAPASSALIARVIRAVFDEREVAVVEGDRAVAAALLDLPFDHIFLTGSPNVGRVVMAAAARHLASVTLELGGKNPAFVDQDVNMDLVVQGIATGRYFNNGQACTATDYVLLPRGRVNEFSRKMGELVMERFYSDGVFDAHNLGRFINRSNYERVISYIDGAVAKGARILFGGKTRDAEAMTLEPTIITDVPADCDLMQDEIFGPVIILVPYDDVQEIFPMVRSHSKPLAISVFSDRDEFVQAVLGNTSSGMLSINGWALTFFEPKLPFGGVNESGIGAYHGLFGFKAFSHERAFYATSSGT
ncbi:aldehyde dehydrogenase family protein [Burkholderia pyrrocinia]|uniref:aldehyde dehydrogenase family protein n=1 Tax=Burkholderia pyrrocinia TaxID=60550 RepID=UPI002AB05DC0|nr:aldehyde dehydrogenase family protein [Burkholderia pyrrocinia]